VSEVSTMKEAFQEELFFLSRSVNCFSLLISLAPQPIQEIGRSVTIMICLLMNSMLYSLC